MNYFSILAGFLFIVLGIIILMIYYDLAKKNELAALSFKLRNSGYGAIIIGIGLIISEFVK